MAKSRYVKDSIRSDNWFTDLTVSEKLLFTYLLTNDKVGLCGVYELPLKKIQRETGIDSGTLGKAFERFESVGKVCYRDGRVMIVNFLKNQSMNDNMVKGAKREAENIGKEVWLSFASFKGFERLGKDFECFDILNFTLLYSTLPIGTAPKGATVSKKFVTPTLEQVHEYCQERSNGIDANAFLAHYDAVGWVYGKDRKPVKDWKACVRTREQKRKEEEKAKEPQSMDQRVVLYNKMGHVPFRIKYGSEKATEVKLYSL